MSTSLALLDRSSSQLIVGAWLLACVAICVLLTRSERQFVRFAGYFCAGMIAGVVMLSLVAVVFHLLTTGGAA